MQRNAVHRCVDPEAVSQALGAAVISLRFFRLRMAIVPSERSTRAGAISKSSDARQPVKCNVSQSVRSRAGLRRQQPGRRRALLRSDRGGFRRCHGGAFHSYFTVYPHTVKPRIGKMFPALSIHRITMLIESDHAAGNACSVTDKASAPCDRPKQLSVGLKQTGPSDKATSTTNNQASGAKSSS